MPTDTQPNLAERLSGIANLAPFAAAGAVAFSAGGFFPGSTALGVIALLVVLGLLVLTAEHPIAGVSPGLVAAGSCLALLAGWILLSYLWSDSPARALLEFDRAFLYLLALIVAGLGLRTIASVRAAVWAAAGATTLIALAGLATRLLPDLFPTDPAIAADRLAFPLTYWNGLGLTAGFAILLNLALAGERGRPAALRVIPATLLAPLAVTLYLTLSRGAIGVVIVGLLILLAAGRSRMQLATLLAAAPFTALALVAAYGGDQLTSEDFADAGDQGGTVALVTVAAMAGIAVAQALLIRAEPRIDALHLPARARLPVLATGAAAVLAALLFATFALDAPGEIEHQADRFLQGGDVDTSKDPRSRLTDFSNNRKDHWDVASDAWSDRVLTGQGAGTFALLWAQDRPTDVTVLDAHSLYLEVLAELGLVGLLLLLAVVGTLLWGAARLCRGEHRGLHAAVLAVIGIWALHTGIDWDWELPAVTIVPLALGGAVLASDRAREFAPGRLTRVVAGLGVLVLALTPFSIYRSQQQLEDAVDAVRNGDCARGIDASLDSIDALSVRPEPYELLAVCNAGTGRPELGERMALEAIDRDPDNWELYYALAIARGLGGTDPRDAAGRAVELNPLDGRAIDLEKRLAGDDPKQWEAAARTAPLLLPADSDQAEAGS